MKYSTLIFVIFALAGCSSPAKKSSARYSCQPVASASSHDTHKRSIYNVEFVCGNGADTFRARCDLSQDPLESGRSTINPAEATWAKHGANEGIDFHAVGLRGFIVCPKVQ